MLIDFFQTLRAAGVPVSVKEWLDLMAALHAGVAGPRAALAALQTAELTALQTAAPPPSAGDTAQTAGAKPDADSAANPAAEAAAQALSIDTFYQLSRSLLVKDERHYDRFDRAFGAYFQGVQTLADAWAGIPADWLRQTLQRHLSEQERAQLQALDWDELMRTLQERLAEQTERHAGGNRWIGTGGSSPFGHGGYNPAGVRIAGAGGQRRAVKVWAERQWRDYDDSQLLGTRNIQVALRRLRRFARRGLAEELDLPGTIRATAANAGYLDLRLQPPRHNDLKVLLLMDVGGSMDDHMARMQELFAAARGAFKHLNFYYFHNCVYDHLWKSNQRRHVERTPTWDVLRTYPRDTRLVFVGDASMSPYEIMQPGGSIEYANDEAGATWLARLTHTFEHHVWINPEPPGVWAYRPSIALVQQIVPERMFAMSLQGLTQAMQALSR